MPILPLTNPALSSVSPPSAQHNQTPRARRCPRAFIKIIIGIVVIVLLARSYPILIFLVFLVLILLFACRKPKNRNVNKNRTFPGVNRVGTVSDGSDMDRGVVSPSSTIPPSTLATASATIRPIPHISPPRPIHPKQTRVRAVNRPGRAPHQRENLAQKEKVEEVVYPPALDHSKETLVQGKEDVSGGSVHPKDLVHDSEEWVYLKVTSAALPS